MFSFWLGTYTMKYSIHKFAVDNNVAYYSCEETTGDCEFTWKSPKD